MTLLHPSSRLPVRRFGAPLLAPSSRSPSRPSFSLIRFPIQTISLLRHFESNRNPRFLRNRSKKSLSFPGPPFPSRRRKRASTESSKPPSMWSKGPAASALTSASYSTPSKFNNKTKIIWENSLFGTNKGTFFLFIYTFYFFVDQVKKSLLSSDGRILEKNDRTPVTIADFGVQALISLELKRLFPSIPLVAEEDSGFLRSNSVNAQSGEVHGGNFLVDTVLSAVADKTSSVDEPLTSDDVLEAIDRGGKDAVSFDAEPSTYWVLDPIDGTRGFLKGSDALYVVGLALVVKGEIAIGVMGCPNWKEDNLSTKKSDDNIRAGVIMIAHSGCGTWTRRFSDVMSNYKRIQDGWRRCFVDSCWLVHEARFCIPDSQTWDFMPLSVLFSSSVDCGDIRDKQKVLLLPTCCGRFVPL